MNIVDIKNNEATQKTVVKFIEDYELSHSEEVWEKEAEKIYSTGGETLYQFRGKYYRGTRPFISRKNSSGRECGNYGEETRTEVTEKDAQAFIEEYENTHPEEIWKKEAEKIYSTGGETLYQFRGKYYRGTRPFISRKNSSGRECGNYGEETRTEVTEKDAQAFIEEYENTHPEEIWKKEAEKIYSTGGETLYQFRGKYYRGTRPFISRKNSSGRECGNYGEETRTEVTEKDAQAFIEEYENTHPEEIWKKEAEKIYSTGGETLYQFRGKYYRGTRPFINRKNSSGRECGSYGEETLQLMRDREENNITLSNIRNAIEYSKDLTI